MVGEAMIANADFIVGFQRAPLGICRQEIWTGEFSNSHILIVVSGQPSSTTLGTLGALSPPHTLRPSRAPGFATQDHAQARDSNAAQGSQHSGHECHFGKHIEERVPGLQRGPKAKTPRPTYSIFRVRGDCHLPAIDTADRRLRLVLTCCQSLSNVLLSQTFFKFDHGPANHLFLDNPENRE